MCRKTLSLLLAMLLLWLPLVYAAPDGSLPSERRLTLLNEIAELNDLLGKAINRQRRLKNEIDNLKKQLSAYKKKSENSGQSINDDLVKLKKQLQGQEKLILKLENTLGKRKKELKDLNESYKARETERNIAIGVSVGLLLANVLQFVLRDR